MINSKEKYFVFGGRKSSDFDVWASGLAIFDTPAKRYKMIDVPGRNGALTIEDGSFENIELTFKDCFIPSKFAENFSALKSYLYSLKGYQRLELSWLPNEYRLATFVDGIEPGVKNWDGKGKFDLTFNCKPQRFLKSGEESISIPCEPAASPAEARRYWRYSQFEEYTQSLLTDELPTLGYTTAEISAMQFAILPIDIAALGSLSHLGNVNLPVEFKGADDDRFFALFSSFNPVDGPGQSDIYYDFYKTKNLAVNALGVQEKRYILVKKSFGLEVLVNGLKIAQDETYQFGTIINPTRFDASPRFRVKLPSTLANMAGATTYLIGAGQNGIAVKWTDDMESLTESTITLDTETMDAYILAEDIGYDEGEIAFVNLNTAVKFYGNKAVLEPGENIIRLDPMIVSCEIVPRWWTI